LIGIDFVLVDISSISGEAPMQENGGTSSPVLFPVAIEVNSLECTTNCDLYENTSRFTSGEAFETFVENAIAASQRQLGVGMTLVVWGGSQHFVSSLAHRYQIHVSSLS
jgi:hypothetical protein